MAHELILKLQDEAELDLVEISVVLEQLHVKLLTISNTLRDVTAREKSDRRSVLEAFRTLTIAVSSIDEYVGRLLLQPGNPEDSLCLRAIHENKWSKGLLHHYLPRLLLRDEMRRLFRILQVDLPFKILEKMEKEWKTLIGCEKGVLYDHFVLSLFPFLVFTENSVESISTAFYRLLCDLNEVSLLTVKMLEEGMQVVTKTWLAVVDKPSLLSPEQVSVLLRDMLHLNEKDTVVELSDFLGGCIIQTQGPESLALQRLMGVLFCQCPQLTKCNWKGEMPFSV